MAQALGAAKAPVAARAKPYAKAGTRAETRAETRPAAVPAERAEAPAIVCNRRRAQFLRDLNEAKELRDRVQPRRARAARMRQAMRMRTFRW
ncbi:hypothetical protein [Streptomyces sp. WAC 06725]|uniref:hypothetical protein n=1 Tax=Streptomyces sp. WAC 06725 TaxID=2203209 RepID=UPI000F73B5AF|nr:hypothetical protein [Streptomyces sp. WAC 06725]